MEVGLHRAFGDTEEIGDGMDRVAAEVVQAHRHAGAFGEFPEGVPHVDERRCEVLVCHRSDGFEDLASPALVPARVAGSIERSVGRDLVEVVADVLERNDSQSFVLVFWFSVKEGVAFLL